MLPENYSYRPLPEGLTIKKSSIEGLGLFTEKRLMTNLYLGYTHLRDKRFDNNLIRTPLGGFINHSDAPNCEITQKGDSYHLQTKEILDEGTELTVDYNKIIK